MKCLICKNANTLMGTTEVSLKKGEFSMMMKNVPAFVCPVCGEAYADEETAAYILQTAHSFEAEGLLFVIGNYQSEIIE